MKQFLSHTIGFQLDFKISPLVIIRSFDFSQKPNKLERLLMMPKKFFHALFLAAVVAPHTICAAERSTGFLQGEVTCFKIEAVKNSPWSFSLKLIATPLKSGEGVPIIQVNGLMHGVRTIPSADHFYAELTGTATLAPSISESDSHSTLQIGLFEADYAPDDSKKTAGIWVGHYGIELKPSNLSGRINGTYSYTPITISGKDPGPQLRNTLSQALNPMDCKDF